MLHLLVLIGKIEVQKENVQGVVMLVKQGSLLTLDDEMVLILVPYYE
jgi:hypothetical protein